MKLQIDSTPHITHMDGVEVRVWNGVDEYGVPCKVFIHRIAVSLEQDQNHYEAELKERLEPGTVIDLRYVL
jgi:hypothetical protein